MPCGRDSIAAIVQQPTISVVVVAHDSLSDLRHSLPALIGELDEKDELIVVDSGSKDGIAEALGDITPRARLVVADGNVGFAGGANIGARLAAGDLLVFLNPDAVVQAGWGAAMRGAWGGRWDVWMALVTMDAGTKINTSGGVVHFSGIGWAGQAGLPLSAAPTTQCSVGFASGACFAIPKSEWQRLGGFSDWYFMYCEDVDLSLRARLDGGQVGLIPDARVVHAYDFRKGSGKWRTLERNRWATIIRCYPATLLVLTLPALVVVELATWGVATREGWATMKAGAAVDVLLALPRLIRERREIQGSRTIGAAAFSDALSSHLESPYLDPHVRRWAATGSNAYWRLVRRLLFLVEGSRAE
jgi:GT2 family glycosyltransferase